MPRLESAEPQSSAQSAEYNVQMQLLRDKCYTTRCLLPSDDSSQSSQSVTKMGFPDISISDEGKSNSDSNASKLGALSSGSDSSGAAPNNGNPFGGLFRGMNDTGVENNSSQNPQQAGDASPQADKNSQMRPLPDSTGDGPSKPATQLSSGDGPSQPAQQAKGAVSQPTGGSSLPAGEVAS